MNYFTRYLQTRHQKFGLTEEAEVALCRALHVPHIALAKVLFKYQKITALSAQKIYIFPSC